MDNIADLLLKGLSINQYLPSKGGLMVADYPNKYGLRAYPIEDKKGNITGYGGEMLPKSVGWLGVKKDPKGLAMTEFSIGDGRGDFPTMVPTLSNDEINSIVKDKNITNSVEIKARQFANERRSQGKSPFYDPFLDALARIPK